MAQTPAYENQRPRKTAPLVPIGALRAALGMTQAEAARKVQAITNKPFTQGAIAAIEGGHRGASRDTLAALEVVYGLKPGSLVTDYDPSHSRRKVSAEDAA